MNAGAASAWAGACADAWIWVGVTALTSTVSVPISTPDMRRRMRFLRGGRAVEVLGALPVRDCNGIETP
ncbi:hypothetical protein GCM10018963_49440 [Saccharothrix longispora]